MALKLIRTKLDRVPPDAHLHDYAVHRNGEPIGRIYRVRAPGRPELAWSWSITASVDPSAEVSTSGTAADLEDAKAAFRANWQKWLRRKAKPDSTLGRANCHRKDPGRLPLVRRR